MPIVQCKQCSSHFHAKPSWIKNGYGIYCSAKCQHKGAKRGKDVQCFICSATVYKQKKALKNSKSGKFFCSKSCQTKWRNSAFIQEKHPNWKGGRHAYTSVMNRSGVSKVCTLCKTKDSRILAVHHVDENRKNNDIDNLVWLCHNCHHLVHWHANEREKLMAAIV